MYFEFFKLHSWGKRSVNRRRRFIQCFLKSKCVNHVVAQSVNHVALDTCPRPTRGTMWDRSCHPEGNKTESTNPRCCLLSGRDAVRRLQLTKSRPSGRCSLVQRCGASPRLASLPRNDSGSREILPLNCNLRCEGTRAGTGLSGYLCTPMRVLDSIHYRM